VQAKLNGTAIQIENNCFLVFEDTAEPEETEYAETAVIDTPETPDEDLQPPLEEPSQEEDAFEELTVDLEDMPPIDLSEITDENEPEAEDTEPAQIEVTELEMPPLAVEESPEEPPQEEPAAFEVPLDTDSLTLDLHEDELVQNQSAEAEVEDETPLSLDDQIPLNLEQIDLSDLVHAPEKGAKSKTAQEIQETDQTDQNEEISALSLETDSDTDNSTITFDSQDLTLETGQDNLELVLDTDSDNSAQDTLEPIDLTLELEPETEKINLSLDDIIEETDKD
jgi:hypothetical protein